MGASNPKAYTWGALGLLGICGEYEGAIGVLLHDSRGQFEDFRLAESYHVSAAKALYKGMPHLVGV